mgnify:CR=1 FL=1
MPDLGKESFMDVLAALIVSEEFQGIVTSETGNPRVGNDVTGSVTAPPKPPQGEPLRSGNGEGENSKGIFLTGT